MMIHANSFPTLADRRAWLAALAEEERSRITTTPTRKRLKAANDNRKVAALDAFEAIEEPHSGAIVADTKSEPMDPAASGKGWRFRPSVGEISAAMATGRVAYRTAPGRTHAERMAGGTYHVGPLVFTKARRTEPAPVLSFGEVVTGDIVVPAGAMIARGISRRGKPLKPTEYRTYQRTDKAAKRRAALEGKRAVESYIALRGTWAGFVSWADRVGGDARLLERPDAARILADAIANTPSMPCVKLCPPAILADGHWLGGVSRPSGVASGHDGYAKSIADEANRVRVQTWLQERIAPEDMVLLRHATSRATADEIAAELGITRQTAVKRMDASLDRLSLFLKEFPLAA